MLHGYKDKIQFQLCKNIAANIFLVWVITFWYAPCMLSFIYSSWQAMFGTDFSSEMTGQFVLLVRETDYHKSDSDQSSLLQEISNGLPDPNKTNTNATFSKIIMDGEMALLDLKTNPPIVAIVKLPCGECASDFIPGQFYSFSGELQFQKIPQLQFLPGMDVSVSNADKVFVCEVTEDIVATVALENVKTCQ